MDKSTSKGDCSRRCRKYGEDVMFYSCCGLCTIKTGTMSYSYVLQVPTLNCAIQGGERFTFYGDYVQYDQVGGHCMYPAHDLVPV